MRKEHIPKDINTENFVFFNQLLSEFDAFPFFGTLLGMHRDNELIENDDDVDFYVNLKHRHSLVLKLQSRGLAVIHQKSVGSDAFFLQFSRKIGEFVCICDVYFYTEERGYILERSNFGGEVSNWISDLKVKRELIFPLNSKSFHGTVVQFPSQPEKLVRYLYGSSWRKPLTKNTQYIVRVFFGRPIVFIGKTQMFAYRVLRKMFY